MKNSDVIAVSVSLGIALGIGIIGLIEHLRPKPIPVSHECMENLESGLDGWTRLGAAEWIRKSELAFEGKVEIKLAHSLLCKDYTPGGNVSDEYVVWQWWWRGR